MVEVIKVVVFVVLALFLVIVAVVLLMVIVVVVVLVVVVRLEPRRGPCGHRDYCACLCYRCGYCGHNVRTLRSHRKCPY